MEDLQEAAQSPKAGYDIHHVVEQGPAAEDGYSKEMIEAPENKVRIPTHKHWVINAWYQTRNYDYSGLAPRDYLRSQGWDERRRVGLDALKLFGVLKP